MNSSFDLNRELLEFTGRAPLFPLPNVVFFPSVLLPLHIFEMRYRRMVADALTGDRLIAMALPKPGWETALDEAPAVFPTVCLGRIAAAQQLPDGRYYLVLQGLSRARLREEESHDLPYRVGRLELLPDVYPEVPSIHRENRHHELLEAFGALHSVDELEHVLHQALDSDVPLGVLCDVLSYALHLQPASAQLILDQPNVDFRSDLVLELLRELPAEQRTEPPAHGFPPQFSRN